MKAYYNSTVSMNAKDATKTQALPRIAPPAVDAKRSQPALGTPTFACCSGGGGRLVG